jgi:hypothetical protein
MDVLDIDMISAIGYNSADASYILAETLRSMALTFQSKRRIIYPDLDGDIFLVSILMEDCAIQQRRKSANAAQ